MSRWTTHRTATVVATTLLVTALGAGTAWAADEPTPTPSPKVTTTVDGDEVTISTDLATAQAACAKVDDATERLATLVARIRGDADTAGSVAHLQARAQHAADAGRDDLANALNARATRRDGWVDDLQRAIDRLEQADATVCDALPEAGQ
jgi:phage shock protein A